MLACSSAGGGLRIAVVGNEELVTAEAGRRVALSSGGKVVAVLSGGLDDAALRRAARRAARRGAPVGGTDGGNSSQLIADADFLVGRPLVRPGGGRRRRRGADEVAAIPRAVADAVRPGRQRGAEDRRARGRLGAGRDPRDVPGARDRRQAPQQARPTSRRWSAARRRTSCSPASSCWPAASTRHGRVPATWSSSTSVARPPTCTASSSSTRRTAASRARSSPRRRSPARSRATSGCAGPRSPRSRRRGWDLADAAERRRRPTPAILPD